MRSSKLKSGFTLVELLVVVSIIAVLIAILLPALAKARLAVQGTVCLANLRDVANQAGVYEAQNNGYLYPTFLYPSQLGLSPGIPMPAIDPGVYGYINPGDTTSAIAIDDYGWNAYFNWMKSSSDFNTGDGLATVVCPKPSNIRDASEVVLVADVISTNAQGINFGGGMGGVLDSFYCGFSPPPVTARPNFHGRHNGRGGVLWADGHASLEAPLPVPSTVTVDPTALDLCAKPASFYNSLNIGYLAPNGSDLTTMSSSYYFVFDKGSLSENNINLYLDRYKTAWR